MAPTIANASIWCVVIEQHQRLGPPSRPPEHTLSLTSVSLMDAFTVIARRVHEMSAASTGSCRSSALLTLVLTYTASKFAPRIAEKLLPLPVR